MPIQKHLLCYLQDHSDIHHENTALKERCTRLETEVKALRKDLVAIQQHMHLPTSLSAFTLDHEAAHQPHQKIQVAARPQATSFTRLLRSLW